MSSRTMRRSSRASRAAAAKVRLNGLPHGGGSLRIEYDHRLNAALPSRFDQLYGLTKGR